MNSQFYDFGEKYLAPKFFKNSPNRKKQNFTQNCFLKKSPNGKK